MAAWACANVDVRPVADIIAAAMTRFMRVIFVLHHQKGTTRFDAYRHCCSSDAPRNIVKGLCRRTTPKCAPTQISVACGTNLTGSREPAFRSRRSRFRDVSCLTDHALENAAES